jgi:uncharacterized RDD family membrane protein YckC
VEEVYAPSTVKRLLAFGVDQFLILLLYIPFIKIFTQALLDDGEIYFSLWSLLYLFLAPAFYEFVFLFLWQKTPGKWLFNLKVVSAANGLGQLGFSDSFLRALAGRLSFFFSSAIYAVAFFRYDRTHVKDWLAETRVVQSSARRKPPQVRWILGSFLFLSYLHEGILSSSQIIENIDWKNKQIEIHALVDGRGLSSIQFTDEAEVEEEE